MKTTTKILVNLPEGFYKTEELKKVISHLEDIANTRFRSHNTIEEIRDDMKWADAIIMWAWPVFTDVDLKEASDLKYIGQITTTQRLVKAALRNNITVSDARHCWSPAVSEFALGLMLNGLRKISDYNAEMKLCKENWYGVDPAEFPPLERQLTGRSVGIVGFGGVGRRLAELLSPFHVDIRIFDPFIQMKLAEEYNAKLMPLDDVMKDSEIIVLCAANNDGTKKMIGEDQIALLRKDSILINVGRASLVDMEAIQKAVEKQHIIAMLDVYDHEPLEMDSPLRNLKNIYLTPHRAGGLLESFERSISMLTYDFEAFIGGREMKYSVTEEMLPSFPD